MAHSSRRRSWLSSCFCLDKWFRLAERRTKIQRRVLLDLETLEERTVPAAPTFTPVPLAPNTMGEMMLLTNGTVMAQENPGNNISNAWDKLTPSATGSYVNGTWSSQAPMNLGRLFFGSAVLPDGRVFVIGGEYAGTGSADSQSFTKTYEIYDPTTDSWTALGTNFPGTAFGDDPVEVMPTGQVLTGYVSGPQTYLFDPKTETFTATGTKLYNDQSDEEAWVKLPDNSILSYSIFAGIQTGVFHAQRYIPATGQWVDVACLPFRPRC
jgi:N-acetylneuraminic acid mutarotase